MNHSIEGRALERIACLKLAVFLCFSGVVFLNSPNLIAFQRLAENGFRYTPVILGLVNFLGAAICLLIRDGFLSGWSDDARLMLFFASSLTILAYLVPYGFIGIVLHQTPSPFVCLTYILLFVVILLVATTAFRQGAPDWIGKGIRLEQVTLACMALFLILGGAALATSQVPFGVTFPVSVLVTLSFGGGIGYILLLSPRVRAALRSRRYPTLFIGCSAVFPFYAILQVFQNLLFQNLLFDGSWIVPLALIMVYSFVALLPYGQFAGVSHESTSD